MRNLKPQKQAKKQSCARDVGDDHTLLNENDIKKL
jgi:hypothetical protein